MSTLLDRSLAILRAMDAKFIVVLPDGTQHAQGDLQLAVPDARKKRRAPSRPIGTVSAHYKPYIESLQVGQMAEVPYGEFVPESLRGGISAYCNSHWGKGSAVTALHPVKNVVEVLRLL